jgi:hypothetical protein
MRDANGRFGQGNSFARGNPHAAKSNQLRSALMRAIQPSDIEEIGKALVAKACQGDVQAAKEILDRCLGKAVQGDLQDKLEALAKAIEELEANRLF